MYMPFGMCLQPVSLRRKGEAKALLVLKTLEVGARCSSGLPSPTHGGAGEPGRQVIGLKRDGMIDACLMNRESIA